MKFSEIELTPEEAQTLHRWLADIARHYEFEAAMKDEDAAEQAQAEERAGRLIAIARSWASVHGPIPWMLAGYQATAAWESWMEGAGYMDVDEHFQPDDDDQELWEDAYRNRLEEIRRAA